MSVSDKHILVAAPHPDDETMGCGGTLLKEKANGARLHWLIFTEMVLDAGYSAERIKVREKEIAAVTKAYGFDSVHRLGYPTAALDTVPIGEIVQKVASVFLEATPADVYVPFPGDAHTDHRIAFDCTLSCTKWFRAPYLRRVLAYEALSETDIIRRPGGPDFVPNLYEDISGQADEKLRILNLFGEEIGEAPFPRSEAIVRAKHQTRGAEAGFEAAEAFMLLKEVRP